MADFNVVGLDDVMREINRHSDELEEIIPEMLKAGAEVIVKAQKAELEAMKVKETGDLIKSIKATPVKSVHSDNPHINIYPHGNDRNGVSNGEKGFIAEYGKHGEPARPWMRTANEKAQEDVFSAEYEVWKNHLGK